MKFSRIECDRYGCWMLQYERGGERGARPIANDSGIVRYPCKPLGRDVLATAISIVGHKLSRLEETNLLNLPVLTTPPPKLA